MLNVREDGPVRLRTTKTSVDRQPGRSGGWRGGWRGGCGAAAAAVAAAAGRRERERAARRLIDRGLPEDVAHRHVTQPFLVHGPSVVSVAEATGRTIEEVTRAFFLVGEGAYVDWLEGRP